MVAWMCCHGEGNRTPRKCRLICEWRDPVPWVDFPGQALLELRCSRKRTADRGTGRSLGVPPIEAGFPAIVTRWDRMRCHGKNGRSCSLVEPANDSVTHCYDCG